MNKLIEEAEELHKRLSDLQCKLVSNLSNDDNEILIMAECFMQDIIKLKDNVVSEIF